MHRMSGDMVDVADEATSGVLISYAHEDPEHVAQVEELARLLVQAGIVVRLDRFASPERRDWVGWTLTQMRDAERVLVVASSTYRRRFEQEAAVDEGRGVQFEALLIREEVYRDQRAALNKFVPVLLPGASRDDIPTLLLPYSGTHYRISEISAAGADELIRLLTTPRQGPEVHEHPADDGRTTPQPDVPIAALHLLTAGGTALAADDVVRCLVRTSAHGAATEFDLSTRTMGAVILGPPSSIVDALAQAVRRIRARLETSDDGSHAERLLVRIGAHRGARPEEATLLAAELANCSAARRMHAATGGEIVVAASTEFFEDLASAPEPYPRSRSYRSWPMRGESGQLCWLAIPGRPPASVLPPEHSDGGPSAANAPVPAPRFSIGTINGNVQIAERDAVVNVVNYFGGSA